MTGTTKVTKGIACSYSALNCNAATSREPRATSHEKGVSALTAIMALLVLSALGMGILSMSSMDQMITVNMLDTSQARYIAEAGIERGIRAVRDDADAAPQTANPTVNGYFGVPSLDGNTATASSGVTNPALALARVSDTDYAQLYSQGTPGVQGPQVTLTVSDIYQWINLLGSPAIDRVELGCRFRRNGTGTGTFQVSYNISGTPGASSAIWNVTAFDPIQYLDITADRSWTWNDIGNISLVASARGNAGSPGSGWFGLGGTNNNYYIFIEYFFLRITCDLDASTEPWYSTWRNLDAAGTKKTVNIALGPGTLQYLPVYDEAEKINLNYATQALLAALYEKCGIPSATAATLAAATVSYRGASLTNPFDTIEEVQQVSGMTAGYFKLIRDYCTVYSWVNASVQRPAGARAPVNINTAPQLVLEAVLDPVAGISSAEATSIAADIITFRNSTPFTCLYASNQEEEGVKTSFAYFLDTQCTYLSGTQRNELKENADASSMAWTGGNVTTTEFCYYSRRYCVVASGAAGRSSQVVKRVFEDQDTGTAGIFNIPVTFGTGNLNYWQEQAE